MAIADRNHRSPTVDRIVTLERNQGWANVRNCVIRLHHLRIHIDARPRALEKITMHKFLDQLRTRSGIYSLGFDPASIAGIALPIGFVVVVGGGLAAYLLLR